jgi:glutamate synthase domain-containing protein 1
MCGIAGLYLKNPELRPKLGHLFSPMLEEMTGRGPDSAGFAIYDNAVSGRTKITVRGDGQTDLTAIAVQMSGALNAHVDVEMRVTHAIFKTTAAAVSVRQWLSENVPGVRVTSSGESLEIYKEIGRPADVLAQFGVAQMSGSHMIGHTRMATESAVTTEGAHPFNTGEDLCLVHNGSLSNHHSLKRYLTDHQGLTFQTENDSEVAAGYLTWRMSEGATLAQALEMALVDLDGFYTFTVGTRDGFAVLRDPVACKPAVIAETDEWVAMASEFRALARLPGVEHATVWEPRPATVYTWGHA